MPDLRLPRSPYRSASHRWRWPLALALALALTLGLLAALAMSPLRLMLSQAPLLARLMPTPVPVERSTQPPQATTKIPRQPDSLPGSSATRSAVPPREILSSEMPNQEKAPSPQPATEAGTVANASGHVSTNAEGSSIAATGSPAKARPELLAIDCPTQTRPRYPEAALAAGVNEGEVSARFLLAQDGSVSSVEILSQWPPGYFEQAVRRAARSWRCNGVAGDSVRVSFPFQARAR